jgi:hypothetical protein
LRSIELALQTECDLRADVARRGFAEAALDDAGVPLGGGLPTALRTNAVGRGEIEDEIRAAVGGSPDLGESDEAGEQKQVRAARVSAE